MRIVRDSLGRAELVGDGDLATGDEIGFVLSSAQKAGTFSAPVPSRYTTTVYQQRKRRLGGTLYWDRVTDYEEPTAEAAARKAEEYIKSKGWQFVPYSG